MVGRSAVRSRAAAEALTMTVAVALLALATPAPAAPQTAGAGGTEGTAGSTGIDGITPEDLRERIGLLAHDSMRGRDTPSPELTRTAEYIEAQFRAFGLRPALGESYQQTYPLTVIHPPVPEEQLLRLRRPDGEAELTYGEDFLTVGGGPSARAEGEVRVISSLEDAPEAAGEVLLVGSSLRRLGPTLERLSPALSESGAAGAVVALDVPERRFGQLARFFESEQLHLGEPGDAHPPILLALRSALGAGRDLTEADGWTAELRAPVRMESAEAMNTIGWLPGSDPELRDEYVIFTAHMDHVGVGRPVNGDSIYNGADDDASGTATIVELAEAFASRPERPRRSLVFMTVSGEEKGLLGSRWYSDHPVFPLERTVANLNIDMIGRNWRDTVVAIGKEESSLGSVVEEVAARHPELGMTVVDDRWPEENFYYRSDHYNFARKGVPILFFFSGVHEDYHRPGDEADRIRYGKTARIARLIYLLGDEVAGADEPPRWDPEAYDRVVESPVDR